MLRNAGAPIFASETEYNSPSRHARGPGWERNRPKSNDLFGEGKTTRPQRSFPLPIKVSFLSFQSSPGQFSRNRLQRMMQHVTHIARRQPGSFTDFFIRKVLIKFQ